MTSKIENLIESLKVASEGATVLRDDLRIAIKNTDSVQFLLVIDLVTEATQLLNKIDRLLNAVMSEN